MACTILTTHRSEQMIAKKKKTSFEHKYDIIESVCVTHIDGSFLVLNEAYRTAIGSNTFKYSFDCHCYLYVGCCTVS